MKRLVRRGAGDCAGNPNLGVIAVLPSPTGLGPLVSAIAGMGPLGLRVLTTSSRPPDPEAAPFWRPVAHGDAVADALADRFWSGGRYGLAGMAIGVACALLISLALLAVPGVGGPVLREGGLAVLFVALGGAASSLPVGLPLGAIVEEHKIEALRRRFRAQMRQGSCFIVVDADVGGLERVLDCLRQAGGAELHCFRG